jgi:Phage tail lysozyme
LKGFAAIKDQLQVVQGASPTSFTTGGGGGGGGLHGGGGYEMSSVGPGKAGARAMMFNRGGGGGGGGGGAVPAGSGSVGALTTDKRRVIDSVAAEWRAAGMSDTGIAGLLANIREESGFNPTLRHPDQPHFGGEAHFAHGLYQEGGTEWNNYASWLAQHYPGQDWRNPALQSRFAAWNLKTHYPAVWQRMLHGNVVGAASAYASGYLKPAANYLHSRLGKFSRGLPGLGAYGVHDHPQSRFSTDDVLKAVNGAPSGKHSSIHIDAPIHLDGRKIASSTMKHMVNSGNAPAQGSRSRDRHCVKAVSGEVRVFSERGLAIISGANSHAKSRTDCFPSAAQRCQRAKYQANLKSISRKGKTNMFFKKKTTTEKVTYTNVKRELDKLLAEAEDAHVSRFGLIDMLEDAAQRLRVKVALSYSAAPRVYSADNFRAEMRKGGR